MDQVARLVLHNGTVRTLDPAGTVAEAVAIAGSRILAVGSSSDMTALADRRTEVIDLGGRTVLPAFTDSHMHFRRASIGMAYHLDFLQLKPPPSATSWTACEPERPRSHRARGSRARP
jgi:hypothetical protein